ncbi:hypothetical protein Misp01_59370 [Microtetraspora sp. NBRC 13810]|uniref:hypothetical protein n=1 Tax=Microtetraspora sp. NBRC 13810 TaxID=3030990 RepID=UPI0024A1F4EB|nr:hypothetical protein [Microtetraspora sp. NBRC 13810]GLW10809.1 hypothetical protein Misp01_59370 [Microtetraspora sp. NBRC 13810]
MLDQLGRALAAADAAAVSVVLAEDVILRVAVHDEPIEGAGAASHVIGAVLDGVLHDIEVSATIGGGDTSILMFSAQVAGHPGRADGLLVARQDRDERISDLTVFVRPLAALQALADEMGRRLGVPHPGGVV